jgi:hypothetical protein
MVGVQTVTLKNDMSYYIVQPYVSGLDRPRQATIISTHDTVEAAYVELDLIAARLSGHGLARDVVELLVVDDNRQQMSRAGAQ